MSINGTQRRDQRRRMVVSWKRSSATDSPAAAAEPRSMAAYGPEAHPDRQKGPATLLPTGIGGFSAAAAMLLVPMVAALALAAAEPLFGRTVFVPQGRFARTVQAAAACFDPLGTRAVAGWLAQVSLGVATAVALIVRLMRRHRRDDYNGRYRAWGWLAGLFVVTACAGAVPLGPLAGAVVADATGVVLGPGGIGWWLALAVVAYAAVAAWAVLPLHERGATICWLSLALIAWSAAAACTWFGGGRVAAAVAGQAAWSLGAALAAVAMLAAARSVIREVRGQCRPAATADRRRTERPAAPQPAEEVAATGDEPDFRPVADDQVDDPDTTSFIDGSESEHRHLSKAERKRLKKLARMNRAAA